MILEEHRNIFRRVDTIKRRIHILSSLRKLVELPEHQDLTFSQWQAIESRLFSSQEFLLTRLDRISKRYLDNIDMSGISKKLNRELGALDLQLAKSFIFFDTYLDILSQRKINSLSNVLHGCEVLASDAIKDKTPILDTIVDPIVFFDRGFGAAIVREGVNFPAKIKNPVPLLQIPYSKFVSKYDLSSVIHEAGHLAMVRLRLNEILPQLFRTVLTHHNAPSSIVDLYVSWISEIGPDFWGFCNCGQAQTSSIKEILSLTEERVFNISIGDPHPPPLIRVLLSIDWCRYQWGHGDWEKWRKEWMDFYPLHHAPANLTQTLRYCIRLIPLITKILFKTRFKILGGKTIPELFNIQAISPLHLHRVAKSLKSGRLDLRGLKPCAQLAVFRWIRDNTKYDEAFIDKLMLNWLTILGNNKTKALPVMEMDR